ncbi:DUF5361 domain-containing protein [Nocardia takedensis]|uniref:DUF5361 domain-containing protein n=1 Tax=Nocardia takedensis TaxID=259390 RepID=UPI0007C43946|nr:DUF5361 domain-containing protein [Nocardia takedensis]
MTWRDLKVVVACAPPDSALSRARRPDDHQWQLGQHLLADIADSLRWLVWAKTKDAQRGRNRPDRIPRPGLKSTAERYGSAAPLTDMNDFLGWEQRP